ncbi:lantibiotic dehydratase [Jatrophihabitans sp.]|uniref:lantibiotic dehydratase n=1 Tax=Jatrophihabitans sp. TaxID=1932789 RepID=UPI002D1DAA3F|nr:lantibiotic dehydratase [Jatrophihabitans sp.]
MTAPDRIRLGTSAWSIWPDLAVRGAGFPARLVLALHDPELSAATDAATDPAEEGYQQAYAGAVQRLSAALRTVAVDPRFREAVAWQNPALLPTCLDKVAAGEPRNHRGRDHQQVIVSYLQRYALKNETIGFFGPVGWARANPAEPALSVRPGPELVSRRTTYFETWGIDELAEAIAGRPGVLAQLRPRRNVACQLDGNRLRQPDGTVRDLTPLQARLFALADGDRTVADLLGDQAEDAGALAELTELDDLGLLALAPTGPIEARPEAGLADRLGRIADPAVRGSALQPVAELSAARDALAAAAGSAEQVLAAGAALAEVFARHTGQAGTRRSGSSYAGRTLVYEDTVRDVRIEVGSAVLAALGGPLGLVLDSARWLLHRIAHQYREELRRLFTAETARRGEPELPLASLVELAGPALYAVGPGLPVPIEAVLRDFQQRWREVLDLPDGAARHQVSCAGISAAAARAFAVPENEPAWSTAIHASPDVMLAAGSAAAVADGDFLLVLGELHMAVNTLEGRLFVEQHPAPDRLLAWAEADHAHTGRIYAIPPKNSVVVSSRGAPPSALLSPGWTYWSRSAGPDSVWPPAPVLAAADLVVVAEGAGLAVRSRSTGRHYDLLEMLSDFLSGAVINAFRPVAGTGHQPRVSIDRLVLSRESWRLPVSGAGWASIADESVRYLQARRWQAAHGLPERGFVSVPVEGKPTAVDFGSLVLVNLLAKLIRRTAAADPAGTVRITELLPDLGQLWLPDAAGERYSCEFRMVAVDGAARAPYQAARASHE